MAPEVLRPVDHGIAYGEYPDRTERGWERDEWPGPSYLDPGSGGPENDFTNRNTTFMTWNLTHLAHNML